MITIKTRGDFSDLAFGDRVESAQTVINSAARMRGRIVNKPPVEPSGMGLEFAIVLHHDGSASLVTNREYLRKVDSPT